MVRYKFDDIAFNITQKRKPTVDDTQSYIGLEHLDSGSLSVSRWGSNVPIKGEKLVMQRGDVLFGKRNAYLRRAAIAPHDGLFSAHGMVLRPNEKIISKNLFPFFICSDYFFNAAIRISVGSLSPTINWSALRELEFNLPDMNEQEKLAELLWAANDTKENYKKLLDLTEELVKTQFIEMFTEKEYEEKPISYFVNTNIEKVRKKFTSTETIKYVDISSIDNVSKKVTGYKEYQLSEAPSRAQQLLKSEDIIISTVRPNLRNFAINTFEDGNLVGTSGFCVLRAEKCPIEYIWGIIMTDRFTADMVSLTTGTNYPAIRDKDILNYQIPDAPESEMQRYADFVKQSDKSKFELQETISSIENTVKSLLKQYIG